jgi:hypothetical protein
MSSLRPDTSSDGEAYDLRKVRLYYIKVITVLPLYVELCELKVLHLVQFQLHKC